MIRLDSQNSQRRSEVLKLGWVLNIESMVTAVMDVIIWISGRLMAGKEEHHQNGRVLGSLSERQRTRVSFLSLLFLAMTGMVRGGV